MISALCLFAVASAPLISFDAARHSVSFSATATGIRQNAPVEFMFVGPDSDRDYEAMFVTDVRVKDIAVAFDKAGIPRGAPVGIRECRFWPSGRILSVSPDIWGFVRDVDENSKLPVVYSGGARSTADVPIAETNMPSAVLALYCADQSLLLLDDALDQSIAYGRFHPAMELEKGEKTVFTFSWDGESGSLPYRLDLTPGNLRTALEEMENLATTNSLDVMVSFSPELSVNEAIGAAKALAILDSRNVRINGFQPDQFFYRAFLPLEKWRDRRERLAQPIEIALGATNTVYTVIDEDWSGDTLDPCLTPRQVDINEAVKRDVDTCFIYASSDTKLKMLYAERAHFNRAILNWYIYIE